MTQNEPVTISGSLCVLLQQVHDRLAKQALDNDGTVADLKQVRRLLEALPLATGEFGLAVNRLANAQRYLNAGEHGAAQYELRLLLRSLDK
jgi:hypothetical protein